MNTWFSFTGRLPRLRYFWMMVVLCLLSIPLEFANTFIVQSESFGLALLSLILSFILAISQLSVVVRRLHDLDRSGWTLIWVVGAFVITTILVAYFLPAHALIFMGVMLLGWLLFCLYLLFVRGTVGPNHFGDDPNSSHG